MSTILAAVACFVIQGRAAEEVFVLSAPGVSSVLIRADNRKSGSWNDHGAGRILQRFGRLITGREIPLQRAREIRREDYGYRIWVGRQPEVDRVIGERLDRLDDDGYLIHAKGRDLYVAGKFWWGSNWAAYHLLETFAGCRWYLDEPRWNHPTEDGLVGPGDIVPPADQIVLPADTSIAEEPDYKARWFRRTPYHSFRLRYRDKFHHALRRLLPPEQWYDERPEYYPEIDGRRDRPKNANSFQPCVSNPGVLEAIAKHVIRHFDENPEVGTVSLGMNDTSRFCECGPCLAAAPAEIKGKSQRIAWGFFDFYNRVAEKVAARHPTKRLGCLAYARLRLLPKDAITLHPMLVPYLTHDSAQLFESDLAANWRREIDGWNRISERMGIYEYMFGKGFVIPRVYNRFLAEKIRSRYGVAADGFYAEAYPNWGLDGPKYWLVSKLLWDVTLDPNKLLDQFYGDMFGRTNGELSPAARQMKMYFDFLEETWSSQTLKGNRSNYRWYFEPKQLEIFPPETCDRAWEIIQRADRFAETDKIRQRIRFFSTTFNITRIMSRRYAMTQLVNAHMTENPDDVAGDVAMLEKWRTAGDLSAAIDAARQLGFAALSNTGSTDMLAAARDLDRQPVPAANAIVSRLVDSAASGRYASPGELRAALNVNSPLVRDLAERGAVFVSQLAVAPDLDGKIEPAEWGAPDFDGRFFRYAHVAGKSQSLLDSHAPERNRMWTRKHGDHLYFAFELEQDPATIGASVTERDTTRWRNADMVNDDCIVLCFHSPGWAFQSIRVNVNGAIADYQNSDREFDVATARVSRTETGWQVEMRVNFKQLNIITALKNGGRPELCVARYTRRPDPRNKGHFKAEATTLTPFTSTGGNIPAQMRFRTGSRVILSK